MTDKWFDKLKDPNYKSNRVSKSTLVKAIKENCLVCSGDIRQELTFCTIEHCPLWPFRLGITKVNLAKASQPTRDLPPCTNQNGV